MIHSLFFCFNQQTAYEMRISDWSSDVCSSDLLRRTSEWFGAPVFIVLQAAPMAALIPLITFTYGIGLTAKTLAVIMLALPVIVLNCYKAVRNVNQSLRAMCRPFLGSPRQAVVKIILPEASPLIFPGPRLGVGDGFVGAIGREASGERRCEYVE